MVLSCLSARLSPSPNAIDREIFQYQLSLNQAAAEGDIDSVSFILRVCRHDQLSLDDAFVSALTRSHLDLIRLMAFDWRLDLTRLDALHLAAVAGHLSIVEFLYRRDEFCVSPWTIRDAGFYRHYHVVEYLLACTDADPTALDSYCLRQAAANNDIRLVQLLLHDGRSNPNAMNGSALRLAARFGYGEVVRRLLSDRRTDPSLAESEALRSAAEFGHDEIVEMLLERGGSDANARDSEALARAASNGHAVVVARLIRIGACRTDDALRLAIDNQRYQTLRVLVRHGEGDGRLLQDARRVLDRAWRDEIRIMMIARKVTMLNSMPVGLQAMVLQMAFGNLMDTWQDIHSVLHRIDNRLSVH